MRKIMSLTFAMIPFILCAQSTERQVIATTGTTASSANVQVSYTIGETATATLAPGSIIVTQGFQQPDEQIAVGVDEWASDLSVNAYPNPVSDNLVLEMNATHEHTVNATVYDMLGKHTGIAVSNMKVNGMLKQTLDVSSLSAGQYLISFTDGQLTLGTVRILKVY